MHKKQSSQDLVNEVLDVLIAELLTRVDDPMEISLHQVSDDVNVGIASPCFWPENVHQPDDIVVFEEL